MYSVLPFFGLKIQSKVVIQQGDIVNQEGQEQDGKIPLDYIIGDYSKAIENIIHWNKMIDKFELVKFPYNLLDSVRNIITNEQVINKCCIFATINAMGNVQAVRSKKYCSVFNCNIEGKKFSVIQWEDNTANTEYVSRFIKLGTPIIFGNIAFDMLGTKIYFKIKPSSFVIYNFCTELKDYLTNLRDQHGNYKLDDIQYIYRPFNIECENHLFYAGINPPRYKNLTDASTFTITNVDKKLNALLVINASQITSVTGIDCTFKYYCKQCNLVYSGIDQNCCSASIARKPWIEGSVSMSWEYKKNQNVSCPYRNSDTHQIGMNLAALELMYNYCQANNINNHDLTKFNDFMVDAFQEKQEYVSSDQAKYFNPLIKIFFDEIKKDNTINLILDVFNKRTKSNSIWQSVKLKSIETCKPNNNELIKVTNKKRKTIDEDDDDLHSQNSNISSTSSNSNISGISSNSNISGISSISSENIDSNDVPIDNNNNNNNNDEPPFKKMRFI